MGAWVGEPLAVVVALAVAPALGGAFRVGEHEARRTATPTKRTTATPPTAYPRRPRGQPMRSPLSWDRRVILPEAARDLSGRIIRGRPRSSQERSFGAFLAAQAGPRKPLTVGRPDGIVSHQTHPPCPFEGQADSHRRASRDSARARLPSG